MNGGSRTPDVELTDAARDARAGAHAWWSGSGFRRQLGAGGAGRSGLPHRRERCTTARTPPRSPSRPPIASPRQTRHAHCVASPAVVGDEQPGGRGARIRARPAVVGRDAARWDAPPTPLRTTGTRWGAMGRDARERARKPPRDTACGFESHALRRAREGSRRRRLPSLPFARFPPPPPPRRSRAPSPRRHRAPSPRRGLTGRRASDNLRVRRAPASVPHAAARRREERWPRG